MHQHPSLIPRKIFAIGSKLIATDVNVSRKLSEFFHKILDNRLIVTRNGKAIVIEHKFKTFDAFKNGKNFLVKNLII